MLGWNTGKFWNKNVQGVLDTYTEISRFYVKNKLTQLQIIIYDDDDILIYNELLELSESQRLVACSADGCSKFWGMKVPDHLSNA